MKKTTTELSAKSPLVQEETGGALLELGQWYMQEDDLCCVTHLGSNYVELTFVCEDKHVSHRRRVLYEDFDDRYSRVAAEPIIEANVRRLQEEVKSLMGEVQALTARLAVGPTAELPSGAAESQALATLDAGRDMGDYKADLVRAKKETLPGLFKQIAAAHEGLAVWLAAPTLPLKAQADQMKGVLQKVDDRLFNVELYAGLSEEVECVVEGAAAPLMTPVHLMQRRCYMDEECLARYEAGGMDFRDLRDFDRWLARPENLERILPHERCIVAFRVRRYRQEHGEPTTITGLLDQMAIDEANKKTFLYIRNGERLYRMTTRIEFEERLFPDLDANQLQGKLWAKVKWSPIKVITDATYQGIVEEDQRRKAEGGPQWPDHEDYVEYSPDNVHYDDIREQIESDIAKHNRIALIIQGLLDRSPVLHPHPPWQLWTPEGFQQALVLVYDSARALSSGKKPDFEAYRRRLNSSLKAGSLTIGQEEAWLLAEGERETDRQLRRGHNWAPKRYRPYGNPGPGLLARVAKYQPRKKACLYRWLRERQTYDPYGDDKPIPASITVPAEELLNVDAYRPGDFRQFYDDPRTREDYLQWAPLLMAAEDYYAGVLKIEENDQ